MLKGKGSYRLFLAFLITMALAGAGLILLVPSLADSGGTLHWVGFAALGLIVVGCMFVLRRVRPDRVDTR